MNDFQLEKVKQALSRMDNDFWEAVTNNLSVLTVQSSQLLDDFSSAFIKLSVTHMNILCAKYEGYQRLIECTHEAGRVKIVEEIKDVISNLEHDKCQCLATLSDLLAQLQALIS